MNLLKKKRWIVCLLSYLMIAVFFASCSKEESEIIPDGVSSEQAIAKFRSLLYKDGEVHANHLNRFEYTEWSIVVKSPEKPLSVFADITGIIAPLKEKYEYKYVSSDNKCSIRIKGQLNAGWDAIYATMYIQIEDCPEISLMHFTTEDFLKEANEDYVGAEPGVPVIW